MNKHLHLKVIVSIFIITLLSWKFYGKDSKAREIPSYRAPERYVDVTQVKHLGDYFKKWLSKELDTTVVPSVAVGVVYNNKLLIQDGVEADIDTPFCIASLTKTFTAIVVLQLVDEGYIKLDDPVRKHLPGVVIERESLKSKPVTIRHLLSHTSGMRGYGGYVMVNANGTQLGIPRQVHPAGYNYSYCNKGFVLLKHLIESVSGFSYSDNMDHRVFIPLGMKSSHAKYSSGTGGIYTTIRDLSKYARMLIQKGRWDNQRLISDLSYFEMLASGLEQPPVKSNFHYSLSWEVITRKGRIDSIYKAGRWFKGASVLQVYPDKGIAFMYLCNPPNHMSAPFMNWRRQMTGRLRHIVKKLTGGTERIAVWSSITNDILRRYAGEYTNPISGDIIRVVLDGNKLYRIKYGVKQALRGFNTNRFYVGGRNLHNFVWKDNRVIGITMRSGFYQHEDL